jgi:transposase-like protein
MQTEAQKNTSDIAREALAAASEIIDNGLKQLQTNHISSTCGAETQVTEKTQSALKLKPCNLSQNSLLTAARKLVEQRRARANFLPDITFGEPVWDILLDLYIAEEIKKPISVSSACLAAGVPATTGLRYVTMLTIEGIILRTPSPRDYRVIYLTLSDETRNSMDRYLTSIISVHA